MEHGDGAADQVGQRAGEIAGDRARRAAHDRRRVEAELIRSEEQGGSGALDLECPRRLRLEAVPQALSAECSEGRDDRSHDSDENEHAVSRPAATGNRPDVQESRRDEHCWIHLRGQGEPEEAEAEEVTTPQEGCERGHSERGRPQVIGVE